MSPIGLVIKLTLKPRTIRWFNLLYNSGKFASQSGFFLSLDIAFSLWSTYLINGFNSISNSLLKRSSQAKVDALQTFSSKVFPNVNAHLYLNFSVTSLGTPLRVKTRPN
jgi:hypothetical protein